LSIEKQEVKRIANVRFTIDKKKQKADNKHIREISGRYDWLKKALA